MAKRQTMFNKLLHRKLLYRLNTTRKGG